jgi:hypothetical protein
MNARILLFIFILTLFAPSSLLAQQVKDNDRVWTWATACPPGNQIRLEALLHAKTIFTKDITVCLMERTKIPQEKHRVLEFFFKDPGAMFDEERPKAGSEKLKGNIWEAGLEPDGLILGVSVVGNNTILLNSLHMAEISEKSESKYGGGLVIKSTPIKSEQDHK